MGGMDRSTPAGRFAALLLMSTCLAGIVLRIRASRACPIRTRPALLGGLLLGGIAMAGHAAHAIDGVWTGPGAEWTTGTNWSSTPTVPDNTATFTNNGAPTSVTLSNGASINTMQFTAAAPAYTFALSNANLLINGGIVNGSSFAPTFTNTQEAATAFFNGSSAANASIFNNQLGFTQFFDSSSAGTATIVNDGVLVSTNNFGGTTNFNDSSTAANATIFNRNNGQTAFFQSSTAGSATLVNSTNGPLDRSMFLAGGTYFFATSSAGNATIINNSGGIAYFGETSSAANATITNNNGGTTYFFEASSAGNATIVNNSGGTVDISGLTTGGTTAGSIAGAGLYQIGSKQLTVGSNNLSTTVSGVIADGGSAGGVGGSLVKVGSGTLTLAGANTYTGGTTLNAGGLVVNGSLASGVTVNGGTLGGSGTIGSLVVNAGTIAPGNSIGTLTVNGNFVQAAGTTYQVEANAQGQADRITVGGTATLNSATVQVLAQPGNYGARTTYTILRANGGVAGTYSGVSSNFAFLTPSLSYDANDVFLTLSVVQDAFSQGGRTFNQKAVGRVLDQTFPAASGDFATVLSTLVGLGTTQGPQILDAISGQNYAGFSNAMVQGAQLFMSNFANRAGSRSGSGAKVALAEACDVACDTTEPALWSAWGGAVGGTGTIAGNNNAGTFTYSVGGFSGGLDRQDYSQLPGRRHRGLPDRRPVDRRLRGPQCHRHRAGRPLWQLHPGPGLRRCAGGLCLQRQPAVAADQHPRPAAAHRLRPDRRQPVFRPGRGRIPRRSGRRAWLLRHPVRAAAGLRGDAERLHRDRRAVARPQRGAADHQLAAHHLRRAGRCGGGCGLARQDRCPATSRLEPRVFRHRPSGDGVVRGRTFGAVHGVRRGADARRRCHRLLGRHRDRRGDERVPPLRGQHRWPGTPATRSPPAFA